MIESRRLPSTGPMKVLTTISAPHMRPLACSSSEASTSEGMSVCPQLSRRTSAIPNSSVARSNTR